MNKDYCIQYFKRYPRSKIQDFIKFLYQSIMGSGHFIIDEDKNYEMLIKEYNSIKHDENHVLFEEISEELVRIHLEPLKRESLKEVHHLIMLSTSVKGTINDLINVFLQVEKGIIEGWIPYEIEDWNIEIRKYINNGCPIVSHTELFRKLYHPHYRLVKREYLKRISNLIC